MHACVLHALCVLLFHADGEHREHVPFVPQGRLCVASLLLMRSTGPREGGKAQRIRGYTYTRVTSERVDHVFRFCCASLHLHHCAHVC